MLKLHASKWSLSLLIVAFSLVVFASEDPETELTIPKGDVVYSDYGDLDIMKVADILYKSQRHTEVVEACEEALGRPLEDAQFASIKHLLAKAYEAIPDHGQDAKESYLEIIKKHPQYVRLPEVAYRLGELNCCIIPEGTEPNEALAIECLKMVTHRLPVDLSGEKGVTYLSLKAHMMLGNIYLGNGGKDKAEECFRKIYECDAAKSAPEPYIQFSNEKNMQGYKTWLQNRITKMKKRLPGKMVSACISDDLAISMQKLAQLQTRYPQDSEINDKAAFMIMKLNQVKEIIDESVNELNIK